MQTKVVDEKDREEERTDVEQFPMIDLNLSYMPLQIALSSDSLTLSICSVRQQQVFADLYDIRGFLRQVKSSECYEPYLLVYTICFFFT